MKKDMKTGKLTKKFILILAALTLFLMNSGALNAYAETPMYGRALSDGVMLYKSPVEHADYALFTLPLSYYVTIVGEEGVFYVVEYQNNSSGYTKIYGYIRKSDLDTENQNPSAPLYYQTSLSVIATSSFIYTRPDDTGDALATCLKEQTLKYYGKVSSADKQNVYYYVKFGSVLGYVPAVNCSAPADVLNPDPLPANEPEEPVQPSPSADSDADGKKTDVLQIVLIAAITIAALIIVYAMFRPGRNKPAVSDKERYFDEDDDE